MKPINKEILIEYIEPSEEKTSGGLYVPPPTNKMGGNANDFLKQGKVIAVGNEVEQVSEGDEILFDYRSRVFVPNMDKHFLVNLNNVYAIL